MNYRDTVQWMFSKLPMYQRQGSTAFKKDLTNIIALSNHLNNPESKFRSIHVGGTNGKGSTSHMIASILQEAGYKVGLYTSPHLKDFRERIKVNGLMISKLSVIHFIRRNLKFLEKQGLSFFEMTVGMAFDHFVKENIDIAVIEVGLGGRLDSTNIITPEASVITNIGYDHTQMLGETLPEIAFEKAGIIKDNIPVIIGEKQDEVISVFKNIARQKNTTLYFAENEIKVPYLTDLQGFYQQKNSKTALMAIAILKDKGYKIKENHIKKGLLNVIKNTGLAGRWQILSKKPLTICDTAHNKEGLTYVIQQLKAIAHDQLHIVLGVVNDKDLSTVLPLFPKTAHYYFCRPDIPRGLDAKILQNKAMIFGLHGNTYKSVNEALKKVSVLAKSNDLIFVGGSTFVVAEVI